MKASIFVLALALSMPAFADGYIVGGAGLSQYGKRSDGNWYQETFPHQMDRDSHTFNLGFGYQFNKTISLEIRGHHLGYFRSYAEYVQPDGLYFSTGKCQVGDCTLGVYGREGRMKGRHWGYSTAYDVSALVNVFDWFYTRLGLYRHRTVMSVDVDYGPAWGNDHVSDRYTNKDQDFILGLGKDLTDKARVELTYFNKLGGSDSGWVGASTLTLAYKF